jgi:hypothetical protein
VGSKQRHICFSISNLLNFKTGDFLKLFGVQIAFNLAIIDYTPQFRVESTPEVMLIADPASSAHIGDTVVLTCNGIPQPLADVKFVGFQDSGPSVSNPPGQYVVLGPDLSDVRTNGPHSAMFSWMPNEEANVGSWSLSARVENPLAFLNFYPLAPVEIVTFEITSPNTTTSVTNTTTAVTTTGATSNAAPTTPPVVISFSNVIMFVKIMFQKTDPLYYSSRLSRVDHSSRLLRPRMRISQG